MQSCRTCLGPFCRGNLHRPHRILVRQCGSKYNRRLRDIVSADAGCEESEATESSEMGSQIDLWAWSLVRTSTSNSPRYVLIVFSVCITSILRMTTLNSSSKSTDRTYGNLNSTIWTTIEANTGIICACLPMLKAPLTALFPKLFPRGSYSGDYYCENSNAARRPAGKPSSDRNSPAAAYDGWGRLVDSKPTAHHGILTKAPSGFEGKASTSTSTESDSAYGMVGVFSFKILHICHCESRELLHEQLLS